MHLLSLISIVHNGWPECVRDERKHLAPQIDFNTRNRSEQGISWGPELQKVPEPPCLLHIGRICLQNHCMLCLCPSSLREEGGSCISN